MAEGGINHDLDLFFNSVNEEQADMEAQMTGQQLEEWATK